MRRSSILIVAVVAGLLAGCEDERAASIRRDRQSFNEALQLVSLVQQDHVTSSDGLAKHTPETADFSKPEIVAAMKAGNLGEFRDSLSKQAESKLEALTGSGPASQRVSAARLLANLKLASANRLRTAANAARNEHASENGFIASALHSIERADSVSKRRLSSDVAEFMAQLGTDKSGAAAKVGSLKSSQSQLQSNISDLETQISDLESQRDGKFDEGRKLRTQGFKAQGQQAFDLYAKAIELEQNGNLLETEAQRLRVQRDLAKAKLSVTESELALAMAWQKAVDDGLGAAEARKQALSKVETAVGDARAQAGKQIVDSFNVVLDAYRNDVLAPLDEAIQNLDDAIKALTNAETQAVNSEDRTAVKVRKLAAQLEKLQVQDDKLVALGTIGRAAEEVYGRVASMIPSSFDAIKSSVEQLRADQTALIDASGETDTALEETLRDSDLNFSEGNPLATARMKVVNAANSYRSVHKTIVEANRFRPVGSTPSGPRSVNTGNPSTRPSTTDDSAAKALTSMAKSLAAYKPNEVWDALPAEYRGDVESWIHTFGDKMDAELWNATFTFAGKLVTLLDTKKDYILANENISALLADLDPDARSKIEQNWDDVVKLISILVKSDLKDLEKVKKLNVSVFLAGTGSDLMRQADKVIAITEGAPVISAMASAVQFKVVNVQGDIATVEITGDLLVPKTEQFQMVQGSWLPKEMVDDWPMLKQQAEAALAELDAAAFAENKAQVMGMLTVLGGMVDNLNQAESQAAFDASVEQIMGLVQGLMGGAGAAPPGN